MLSRIVGRSSRSLAVALVALGAAACREADDGVVPWENTRVAITSDPEGALIEVDGARIGRTTPTTLSNLVGRHTIAARMEYDGAAYGYRAEVDVRGDSVHSITGPLMYRCDRPTCPSSVTRERALGTMRVYTQPNGALFTRQAQGNGLQWPLTGVVDSYVSTGLPLVAMIVRGTQDTVALGIYNTEYLKGRPQPVLETTGPTTTLRQSMWIVPPSDEVPYNLPTVRGIEVQEELIGTENSDVVFLKLTFRNITNRQSYRAADPIVPPAGLTFEQSYVGFALDTDIGNPADDLVTYEPDLDLVYAYDSNFLEENFNTANASRPGLVGLKLVSAPAGASSKVLNAWPLAIGLQSGDWHAGTNTEATGFGVLNGWRSPLPDYPGQLVGFTPSEPGDYRIWVGAGPLTLAPGDSVSMTVAIIMAAPVEGEYTSGLRVATGDPLEQDRQIRRVAATLIERARTLVAP